MSEKVSVDLHQKFYIPYGLKKRIKKTIFPIEEVLYDALIEADLKLNAKGERYKIDIKAETLKQRNKLAMRIEMRFDRNEEIEFDKSEVDLMKNLLGKPLSRGFDNLVIAQCIAYLDGKTEYGDDDCPLYFKKKFEEQSPSKFKIADDEKMRQMLAAVKMTGFDEISVIKALLAEMGVENSETLSEMTLQFMDEIIDEEDEKKEEKPPAEKPKPKTRAKKTAE